MAGILANSEEIATPAPGPLRYGLFSAATVSDNLDARGIASGFQFPALDCGTVRAYDANCATHPEKTFDEGLTDMDATPYWLYATRRCGTVGTTAAEIEASVRRRFASGEQRAVEVQFWGAAGTLAAPSLVTAVGVTTVVASAPGAGAAIAALEDSFYDDYGYVGTIHIAMRGYAAVRYAGLVDRQGATLNTPIGSVWSIGAGYGITGPLGVAPAAGNVWAFMTPSVLIRRSELMVPPVMQTMNRTANQWNALAERVYAHSWTCPVVHAVEVPIAAPKVDTEAV